MKLYEFLKDKYYQSNDPLWWFVLQMACLVISVLFVACVIGVMVFLVAMEFPIASVLAVILIVAFFGVIKLIK